MNNIKLFHVPLLMIESYNNGTITFMDNEDEEPYTYAVLINKFLIDIYTKSPIYPLEMDENKTVTTYPLYYNTLYTYKLEKVEEIPEELYSLIIDTYQDFIIKTKLVQEKKLVMFPQEPVF